MVLVEMDMDPMVLAFAPKIMEILVVLEIPLIVQVWFLVFLEVQLDKLDLRVVMEVKKDKQVVLDQTVEEILDVQSLQVESHSMVLLAQIFLDQYRSVKRCDIISGINY